MHDPVAVPVSAASKSDRRKSDVPSVEKALDVIELLAEQPQGLTMNEIALALQRTMGELYRIVVYLTKRGYLHQDLETDRYALTLQLFELSHRYEPVERLISHALPEMERVASTTEQSCHLAVLRDCQVLVLASVPGPRPAGYSVRTGGLFPMAQTSSGAVLLAYRDTAWRERILDTLPAEVRLSLDRRIARIRKRGYDKGKSTLVKGVDNLSAAVFDRQGVVAALTMGYIQQVDSSCSMQGALQEVIAAAAHLSRLLGGKPATSNL